MTVHASQGLVKARLGLRPGFFAGSVLRRTCQAPLASNRFPPGSNELPRFGQRPEIRRGVLSAGRQAFRWWWTPHPSHRPSGIPHRGVRRWQRVGRGVEGSDHRVKRFAGDRRVRHDAGSCRVGWGALAGGGIRCRGGGAFAGCCRTARRFAAACRGAGPGHQRLRGVLAVRWRGLIFAFGAVLVLAVFAARPAPATAVPGPAGVACNVPGVSVVLRRRGGWAARRAPSPTASSGRSRTPSSTPQCGRSLRS